MEFNILGWMENAADNGMQSIFFDSDILEW